MPIYLFFTASYRKTEYFACNIYMLASVEKDSQPK